MNAPANHPLAGVYAAALTPLTLDGIPDCEAILKLLDFLARRGCHGALLFGTTGEGPSFAPAERLALLKAALPIRQAHPGFRLLAGTGTPSLEETIALTRTAFDLGYDGVVVLPPYYYRKATDDGLVGWFSAMIRRAVPTDGAVLGYHIPPVSGVPLSLDLLARLKDTFPQSFAGIKDSSGDPEHARQLGARFGADLLVLTGNDRLLTHALQHGASGCITALANLYSPELRQIWETFRQGQPDKAIQERLSAVRAVLDRYPPAPALLKALLARRHAFPRWPVHLPLLPTPAEIAAQADAEMALSS
jgi:4-hydroxy-tetrahydrodipicolinate synthase